MSRFKPCLLAVIHRGPLKYFTPRQFRHFFCRHFFWLFFALPCRFACVSGTRRQNCTRYTKEIRFPPGRSRPVFPAEDKSSFVLLPSTYLICQIKYFLDTFCESFLGFFRQKKQSQKTSALPFCISFIPFPFQAPSQLYLKPGLLHRHVPLYNQTVFQKPGAQSRIFHQFSLTPGYFG